MRRHAVPLAALLALAAPTAFADPTPPQPLPLPPPLPAPRDVAYPGHLTLQVDATDLARHVMGVHEHIPVGAGAGDLVLLYPKWIPGEHGPTGPLPLLAGLTVRAGGTVLPWVRDPVAVEAFHVKHPAGTGAVDLTFQFTSPATASEGRVRMTPAMVDLSWNDVLLYPAGTFVRDIPVDASVTLPAGWKIGTALTATGTSGNVTRFATVPLDVLVDSPLLAGSHVARFDLTQAGGAPVHLDVAADSARELAASADELAAHRALVVQEGRLFGSHHYDHYDFLLFLSDELSEEGLEHHRSSENAVDGDYFTDWKNTFSERDLLPHEYAHSWNGKFRRPADLWAPDYSVPERDTLLWVYEGQTQYWGQVLAARSGLWSPADARDSLAFVAAYLAGERGRLWRPVEDTTASAITQLRRPIPWPTWSREEDYYEEAQLVWLDADTLIRERTGGKKSLDDFARTFFGGDDGWYGEKTYVFDDVVRALDAVCSNDWAGFLRTRLYAVAPTAPLGGITRGGYRLAFDDSESAWEANDDKLEKRIDFSFSVGLVAHDNKIADVSWGSPAYAAGLLQGDTVLAVDGRAIDDGDDLKQALADAITAARAGAASPPITLVVRSGEHVRTLSIPYHDGLRYPHLVRTSSGPALLDAILAPRP